MLSDHVLLLHIVRKTLDLTVIPSAPTSTSNDDDIEKLPLDGKIMTETWPLSKLKISIYLR